MKNSTSLLLLLFLLPLSSCMPTLQSSPQSGWINLEGKSIKESQPPILEVDKKKIAETGQSSIITFQLSSMRLDQVKIDKELYHTTYLEGFGPFSEPGKPNLPTKGVFIEIPKNCTFKTEIIEEKTVELNGVTILPMQPPAFESANETPFFHDKTVYNSKKLFPSSPIISSRLVKIRNKNLVELRFTPFLYSPDLQKIFIKRLLRIKVSCLERGK